MDKTVKTINKIIDRIMTIVFLLLILIGIYALYDNYLIQKSGTLPEEVVALKPDKEEIVSAPSEEVLYLKDLKELNPDIVGWITIDDTTIDYPVVQGIDNDDYLDRNYLHEYATTGSIFLDYRNDRFFSDQFSVIYGHHINTGMMFTDIKKFEDDEFFNSHLTGTLYTENVVYDIKIISYAIVLATEDYVFDVYRIKNQYNHIIINFLKENSIHFSGEEVVDDDKLLVLSTCDSLGSYKRAILFTKLVESTGEKEITQAIEEQEKPAQIIQKSQVKASFQLPFSYRKLALILLSIFVVFLFLSFGFRMFRLYRARKKIQADKEVI